MDATLLAHGPVPGGSCLTKLFVKSCWSCAKSTNQSLKWLDLEPAIETQHFTDEELLRGDHLRQEFERTNVLQTVPSFLAAVTKHANDIVRRHAVLVIGHTGHGKSTLCNSLRNNEGDLADTGRTDGNVTKGVYAYDLPSSLDDVTEGSTRIFLVDTEGWRYEKFTSIVKQYQQLLSKQGLAHDHNPHIVLFVVSGAQMREIENEVPKMKRAFRQFEGEVPVIVIPVVTYSATIGENEVSNVQKKVKKIAQEAFPQGKATVMNSCLVDTPPPDKAKVATPCVAAMPEPGSNEQQQPVMHLIRGDVKKEIEAAVQEQMKSEPFREKWLKALASDLSEHCQTYCRDHPEKDSQWGVFEAAVEATAAASNFKLPAKSKRSYSGSSPPWWVLKEVPQAHRRTHVCKVASKHLFTIRKQCLMFVPWILIVLIVVLAPVFLSMYRQLNALTAQEKLLKSKINELESRVTAKIDAGESALESRVTAKIDACESGLNTRVEALEGRFAKCPENSRGQHVLTGCTCVSGSLGSITSSSSSPYYSGACQSAFRGSDLVNITSAAALFGWGVPSVEWVLCYKKSRDWGDSYTFHSRCNNKGSTVTVLQLSTSRLIGGYWPGEWTSSGSYKTEFSSFLFSLTNNCTYKERSSYSVFDASSYGPTFGSGQDLYIAADLNSGSCSLGSTYSCRPGFYSTACYDDFCGTYNGWTVMELEVFVEGSHN